MCVLCFQRFAFFYCPMHLIWIFVTVFLWAGVDWHNISVGKLFDWKNHRKKFDICFGIWGSNQVQSGQPIHFIHERNYFLKSNHAEYCLSNHHFWPILVIFGQFWSFLANFGHFYIFCQYLTKQLKISIGEQYYVVVFITACCSGGLQFESWLGRNFSWEFFIIGLFVSRRLKWILQIS